MVGIINRHSFHDADEHDLFEAVALHLLTALAQYSPQRRFKGSSGRGCSRRTHVLFASAGVNIAKVSV